MTPRPDGAPGDRGAPAAEQEPVAAPAPPVQRWRLVVRRGAAAANDARAWQAALADGIARAGLPVAGTDASPPRPRITLAVPLPAGIPGEEELVDVFLRARVPAWRLREAVSAALPSEDALVEAFDVWLGEPPLPGRVAASVYRTTLAGGADSSSLAVRLADAGAAMLAAPSLPRTRRKGETLVPYELRPFLAGLSVEAATDGRIIVRAVLRHDPEKGIGRPDEVLAELGERAGLPLVPLAVVRERLLLADELAPDRDPTPERAASRARRSRSAR